MVRADRQEIPLRVLPGHRVGKEPIDLDLLELAVRVLVEAAHPDIADAVTVYGWLLPLVCQDELYNPGQDVPINPTSNPMLTHQRPFPDVRLGHTSTRHLALSDRRLIVPVLNNLFSNASRHSSGSVIPVVASAQKPNPLS